MSRTTEEKADLALRIGDTNGAAILALSALAPFMLAGRLPSSAELDAEIAWYEAGGIPSAHLAKAKAAAEDLISRCRTVNRPSSSASH